MIMDTIKQYIKKNFLAESSFSKIKRNEKRSGMQLQSDSRSVI